MSKNIYLHPAPVRVWHWINAFGFIMLVLTGLQIRFAEMLNFMSLKDSVTLHNYVGLAVAVNYLLWYVYYFYTGKIRIYYPDLKTFVPNAVKQIKYYGYGIFKGDPNPHHMTPDHKFNALQQKAYVGLMFVFVPAQIITGIFLWQVKGLSGYIDMLGGIKIVDTIHVLLFYFFAVFMFVHTYLATLGHTPTAHFKAMFTGYEEEHDHS